MNASQLQFNLWNLCLLLMAMAVPCTANAFQADVAETAPLQLAIEEAQIGINNAYSDDGVNYVAIKVQFKNLTDAPLTIAAADVELQFAEKSFVTNDEEELLGTIAIRIGDRSYPVSKLKLPESVTVPPETKVTHWTLFAGMERAGTVPKMELRVKSKSGLKVSLNVNEEQNQKLKLTHRRLGPGNALALFTIAGTLDTVNIQHLVDQMQAVHEAGSKRLAIRNTGPEIIIDALLYWLTLTVEDQSNTNRVVAQYPRPPRFLAVAISDSKFKQEDIDEHSETDFQLFLSLEDAVSDALRDLFIRMNDRDLQHAIRMSEPLIQQAALWATWRSADRLPEALLSQLMQSSDKHIRRVTLLAIGQHPTADLSPLFESTNSLDENKRQLSMRSLFKSRRPIAREAIHELVMNTFRTTPKRQPLTIQFDTSFPTNRVFILKSMAEDFRTEWNTPLVQATNDSHEDVRVTAYNALEMVGHPNFVSVLARGLKDESQRVQAAAFELLVEQSTPESEFIAVEYALSSMQSKKLSHTTVDLIEQTRDSRFAPLLMKRLDNPSMQNQVISLLLQVGDDDVVRELIKRFDQLEVYGQTTVLQMGASFKLEELRPLLAKCLKSKSLDVRQSAIEQLVWEDDEMSVPLLVDALNRIKNYQSTQTDTNDADDGQQKKNKKKKQKEEKDNEEFRMITQALGQIGTPAARDSLEAVREKVFLKGALSRLSSIRVAFRIMSAQSPGWGSYQSGLYHLRRDDNENAIKSFEFAIKADPQLGLAYSSLANIQIREKEYEAALKNFEQAYEIDEYDGQAITGIGICRAVAGDPDFGIQLVEETSWRFRDDYIFSYNTACVYGRAVEALKKREKIDNKLIKELEARSMTALDLAIKTGFDDFELMSTDNDLDSFRELKEFQRLLKLGEE